MSGSNNTLCPQCGATIRADELLCPSCLLSTVSADNSGVAEERLFQQALALEPDARLPFIREATRENPSLFSAVRMLLEGYQEAGGDAALPTQGDAPNARAQWAMAANEEPGTVIDHFRLIRLLGEGGMGSVWRAEQTAPVQRTVALKVIKLGMDTREVVKRFERERQTLALLNHPNIAQVFEAGATALGRPYFAMELVEGQPITAHCESAALDIKARLHLFQEVCSAVEHAHQKGVIHRDLKPSNILVAGGAVKVIDFGVAKATQGAADTLYTRQAQILGTPAYMSPEQAQSAGVDIDTRTDVYALGVVLYEILTGALPIDSTRLVGTNVAEMQRILLEEDPPTPSARITSLELQGKTSAVALERRSALRGDLDWVVMKAIRKDRNERYASAAALSEDLRRYLVGEPVSAVPPTLRYQMGKFVRRHRTAVAAALLVSFALVAGTVVSVWQAWRANHAQRAATLTVADMHTRSGLAAGANGDASKATLWFANAAVIASHDLQRVEANRVRAAAWRREIMAPVRALETGFGYIDQLLWNPRHPSMIIWASGRRGALVWDLAADRRWDPGFNPPLELAVWDASGDRLAALAGPDITVLDYPSGKELARLPVAFPATMAFSPDGRWLAVGMKRALLWDWQTGECRPLALQDQAPADLRFSADGSSLLLGWNRLVGICATDSPATFRHPPVPNTKGARADFLADGRSYFTGSPNQEVQVRDVITGTVLESFPGGRASGLPIAASPDDRFIARKNAPVIDRTSRVSARFPSHKNVFDSSAFSPDGAWLASGSYDDTLKLWELPSGRFLGQVGNHQHAVLRLAFSPDGTLLASSQDGLVRLWRVARPPLSRPFTTGSTSLATLSRDGQLLAPSGFTHLQGALTRTRVINIATGEAVGPDLVPGGVIMDAAFSPDGAWLALVTSTTPDRLNAPFESEGGSGNLQFWDYRTGRRLGEPVPLPSEPRGIAVHPSGNWTGVYCGAGEGVEIEVATRRLRGLFNHQKHSGSNATLNNGRCAYSPDGLLFAGWGLHDFLHLWDRAAAREWIEPIQGGTIFDVDFSGTTVGSVLMTHSSRLEFRDMRTGRNAAAPIPYNGWPFLGRFSADGQLFLTTGRSRNGQVWDWRKGKLVCPALPHEDEVMAGAFVPGRPWVVTGGHDGMIKFWDHRTGMLMCPPIRRAGWVLDLQLTPDGQTLIASGHLGGVIELFDLKALVPDSELDAESGRLLAEIEAAAEVHPGGDLVPLSPDDWLKRWQTFHKRHPDYAGHRLRLEPAVQRAWHQAQTHDLEPVNPGAAAWHRRRVE